jgi:hypothetical protein
MIRRLLPIAAVVALVAAVFLVGAWVHSANTRAIWCDGIAPVWMLQAQHYNGGGCYEVLPSEQAPPNADWRPYCTGLCEPGTNPSDVRFPQPAQDP